MLYFCHRKWLTNILVYNKENLKLFQLSKTKDALFILKQTITSSTLKNLMHEVQSL
jgi:hypothetical protein